MKKQSGFTVIEIMVFFVILVTLGVVFFIQKNNLEVNNRDNQRRTAINAMYYNLTEVYHKEHGYYPTEINRDNLTAMDPDLFIDPFDVELGEEGSEYHYEAIDCDNDGQCQQFKLSADMEREAEFKRSSED